MERKQSLNRYRRWYGRLLRLYAKPYHERFAGQMEQTFTDLLRDKAEQGRGLFFCALRLCIETFAGIVREDTRFIMVQHRNIARIAVATGTVLLIPLIAMQFTDEVDWSFFDFVAAGIVLFGAGLTFELIARRARNHTYRIAVGIAVLTGLLLIWSNLAVGIIGSEDNPANLMYNAVFAVGFLGAIIGRLQSRGMARTLFAMALTQTVITAIALVARMDRLPGASIPEILNINSFFIVLWIGSALLFWQSHTLATEPNRPNE